MNIVFEKMDKKHQTDVMRIFNYYVETSTAAFALKALPEEFFGMLLKKSEGYPAYVLIDSKEDVTVGFCQLSAYNPFPTFKQSACLTYFIDQKYTAKGIGSTCLAKLESDAKQMGISCLLAEISTDNVGSKTFHKKHGFQEVGRLEDVGEKFGRKFGIIYLQKSI